MNAQLKSKSRLILSKQHSVDLQTNALNAMREEYTAAEIKLDENNIRSIFKQTH